MGLRSQLFGTLQKLWDAGPGPTARRRARALASGGLGTTRLIGDMGAITSGPDAYIRGGLKDWRAKARWLCATNPYAKQAKQALKTNLIGHRGIKMRANVMLKGKTSRAGVQALLDRHDGGRASSLAILAELEELRKREKSERHCQALETAWERFCRADTFDLSGRLSFHGFQLQIAGSLPGAGGCMVRAVPEAAGKGRAPVSFELLAMDRLYDDKRGPSDTPGHHWIDGIEFNNRTGRITAYAILKYHPGELDRPGWWGGQQWERVTADQIAHIFIPEEIGQTREVPWLLPVLTTVHGIAEYEKSHWTRKRVINNTLGFIEEEESDFPGAEIIGDEEDESTTEDLLEKSSPGQYVKLKAGEKVTQPQFGPDDQSFEVVLKTMLRRFSAGVGISYSTISRDYGDVNFSSLRQSVLDDRDAWRVGQALIAEQFCQWAYEKWLDAAIWSGALPATLFGDYWENPDRYLCPVWQPRSWQWVDPLRELKGLELALRTNQQTLAQQIADNSGEDLETVLVQRAYEVQLIEALGLPALVESPEAPAAQPTDGG